MAEQQYRFGGPIPEGARRLKERREAREQDAFWREAEARRPARATRSKPDGLGPELIDGRRGQGAVVSAHAPETNLRMERLP